MVTSAHVVISVVTSAVVISAPVVISAADNKVSRITADYQPAVGNVRILKYTL